MARKKQAENEENIFWVTMSDLFLGMFMVFATLFFAFVTNSGQGSTEVQEATSKVAQEVGEEMEKINIKVKLIDEKFPDAYKPDEKSDLEIDPVSGLVRISDLELFELNSAKLTPKGKMFLNKFIPVYFATIYKQDLAKHINSVIIQGHTDSTNFKGRYSVEQQYLKNMNLSMNRAYNVADFIFAKCSGQQYQKDLLKTIRVEGASSSIPIKINGVEDKTRSRRVELRLQLKHPTDDILSKFLIRGATYEDFR